MAGAVFARGEDLEGIGGIYRDDLAAEGSLQQFEFVEGQAGDAAVIGVVNLAVEAEGGADEAVVILAVGLDFQMEVGRG